MDVPRNHIRLDAPVARGVECRKTPAEGERREVRVPQVEPPGSGDARGAVGLLCVDGADPLRAPQKRDRVVAPGVPVRRGSGAREADPIGEVPADRRGLGLELGPEKVPGPLEGGRQGRIDRDRGNRRPRIVDRRRRPAEEPAVPPGGKAAARHHDVHPAAGAPELVGEEDVALKVHAVKRQVRREVEGREDPSDGADGQRRLGLGRGRRP